MISPLIESGLAGLQQAFAEAIINGDAPIPLGVRAASGAASASRFAVYRNNVAASLLKAVGARYPVTRKLLSPQSFDHIAHLYILAEPPRSPVLLEYGESFPQFLRMLGHGHAAEYVADVAELEAARTRAYHAADAAPVSKNAFAGLATDELPDLRIAFHPSISLLKSNFPVVTIWETNLYANDNSIREWNQESAHRAAPPRSAGVAPPGWRFRFPANNRCGSNRRRSGCARYGGN